MNDSCLDVGESESGKARGWDRECRRRSGDGTCGTGGANSPPQRECASPRGRGKGEGGSESDVGLASQEELAREIQRQMADKLGDSAVVLIGPRKSLHDKGTVIAQGLILLDADLRRRNPAPRMRQAQIRTAELRGYIGCFPMFVYTVDKYHGAVLSIHRYRVESEAVEVAHSKVLDAFRETCASMGMVFTGIRGGGVSIFGEQVVELDFAKRGAGFGPCESNWGLACHEERMARERWTKRALERQK